MRTKETKQARVRFRKTTLEQLISIAKSRNVTVSHVVDSVLQEWLSPIADPVNLKSIEIALAELKTSHQVFQHDLECFAEAFAYYTYQWFCHTVSLPTSQKSAAAIDGKKRYRIFLERLRTRLEEGRSFLGEISARGEKELETIEASETNGKAGQ